MLNHYQDLRQVEQMIPVLGYDFSELMVSLIEQGEGKISDNQDIDSDLLFTYQQCDDTKEIVCRTLSELAAIGPSTTTHLATERTEPLKKSLHKHR